MCSSLINSLKMAVSGIGWGRGGWGREGRRGTSCSSGSGRCGSGGSSGWIVYGGGALFNSCEVLTVWSVTVMGLLIVVSLYPVTQFKSFFYVKLFILLCRKSTK